MEASAGKGRRSGSATLAVELRAETVDAFNKFTNRDSSVTVVTCVSPCCAIKPPLQSEVSAHDSENVARQS
jgi:hypothetical protein